MITPQIKRYCKEYTKIENYELAVNDPNEIWVLHHRLETYFSDGTLRPVNARLSMKELKALNMYYDRPPEELIFLKRGEHQSLHVKDKLFSEEFGRKVSEAKKGHKTSKETRRKLSVARKLLWQDEEYRQKILETRKGRHWYNNGVINIRSFECPEGFVPGRLK